MTKTEMKLEPVWRTSSHSGEIACVEIAVAEDVLVRDSKQAVSPLLHFTPAVWRDFAERCGVDECEVCR